MFPAHARMGWVLFSRPVGAGFAGAGGCDYDDLMSQETTVRPELYVKVCMAVVALSLLTLAVCQVILVLRPPPQPMIRRPVVPMENRMMQQGQPPMPPGMMPPGMQQGQGMPEGAMQRPPPSSQGQPAQK